VVIISQKNKINLGLIASILVSIVTLAAILLLLFVTQRALETKTDGAKEITAEKLKNDLDGRLRSYIDQQYGFRALFDASDSVTQTEFNEYFNSIDLSKRYPGFYAITLIRYVEDKDVEAYKAQVSQDEVYKELNTDLSKLQPSKERDYILPVTFILPLPKDGGVYSADLAKSKERREALLAAKNTGEPAFSEVFNLNTTVSPDSDATGRKGFVVTVPISMDNTTFGFINAVFDYNAFYTQFIDDKGYGHLGVKVIDRNGITGFSKEIRSPSSGTKLITLESGNEVTISYPEGHGLAGGDEDAIPFILIIGTIIWVLVNSVLIQNLRKRSSAIKLAEKITVDLKNEKVKAVAEEEKVKSILQSIGDGVFAVDVHKKIILFNGSAEELSGYSADEVIGRIYNEVLLFTHEENGEVNNTFINESLSGKKTTMANHTNLQQKDGSQLSVADSASPIFDGNGKVVGSIVVFRDASKERELSRRADIIAKAKAEDDALLSALGEGLIVFDNDGIIIRTNKVTSDILGYSEDELLGKAFIKKVRAYNFDGKKLSDSERPASKKGSAYESVNTSLEYETKSGERVPVRISIAPIFVHGSPSGAVTLFQDISEERELDRSKDDFIGLVSHQLSTPATAVKANLGMIVEGIVEEADEIKDAVEQAYESNERQIQIVQDFLNVARLENNRLMPQLEDVNLQKMIESVLHDQKLNLDNRKHKVSVECSDSATVYADSHILSFVINNLVNNAGKYSDEGKPIHIEVRESQNTYHLSVIDEGVGVAAEDLDKLFKRFSRVNNDLSAIVGGTGLGLYIAKKMVTIMNGTLEVRSEKNVGSRFIVTLPKGSK
jgi:two-component system sensor histidine kinase VicK